MKILSAFLISCFLLTHSANLFAHGDTHERIEEINQLLLEDPDNAMLYFKRACLYLDHNEFTNAIYDLDKSTELNPRLNIAYLRKADLFYQLELMNEALSNVNHYLNFEKENTAKALLTRARIYAKQAEFEKSTIDYHQVLKTTIPELPEIYFELVEVYLAKDNHEPTHAIECLESGIEKLGDVHYFHTKIISLYCDFGEEDKALKHMDGLINRMPRKEAWYKLKADILKDLDRKEESLAEYNLALESIQLLSEHRKNTDSTKKLKDEIEFAIQSLINN